MTEAPAESSLAPLVVLDTMVVIRAVVGRREAADALILRAVATGEVRLAISDDGLRELQRVMNYDFVREKIADPVRAADTRVAGHESCCAGVGRVQVSDVQRGRPRASCPPPGLHAARMRAPGGSHRVVPYTPRAVPRDRARGVVDVFCPPAEALQEPAQPPSWCRRMFGG